MGNAKVYSILILVMFVWGMNVTWLKVIVSNGEPLTMQTMRVFLAGITVFIILKLMKQKLYVQGMPWKYILIGCFFGVICHHGFLAYGIERTTAMKTAIISGLSPLITAFIAVVFKDTIMTKTKAIGFALGGVGVLIAVVDDFTALFKLQLGDFFVFMSFFLQAFSFIAIRRATRVIQPMLMTGWMLVLGSSVLLVFTTIIYPTSFGSFLTLSPFVWTIFLLSAILATAIGHTLYNLCIKHIGAAESAIFTNFNTMFALFGAALFLNEIITWQQLIGCFFIIAGVVIGTGNVDRGVFKRMISWRFKGKKNEPTNLNAQEDIVIKELSKEAGSP
ncbi:DMT family transporter [Solibacillus sp. CAU 1738]|uniref:DMT family transporter n=1 Tax=Solibacillus sp. CAU 1738 TaxID=3140363 RepID=UPI003260FFB0